MIIFGCHSCNSEFNFKKEPEAKGNYPYSHVKCPICKKSGNVYFERNSKYAINVISDTLGDGVKGMLSHADGKHYDSKSAYYSSLKEKGLVINESGFTKSRPEPKINEKAFDRAFRKTMERYS